MIKKAIAVLIVVAVLISMFPNVSFAATYLSSGTYDLKDFGNDSIINIYGNTDVKLTNVNNVTYTNLQINCSSSNGKGVRLTINNVKIDNSAYSACALSYFTNSTGNKLILEGDSSLKSGSLAGIMADQGTALEISGTGSVAVYGAGTGAGIGGAETSSTSQHAGNITISSGTVTAYGGGGAGIGGGYSGNGGTINITGGTVTAYGGSQGAGIGGGGSGGSGGDITISRGTVTAIGGPYGAAGIGGGSQGSAGSISISGGTVFAQKASNGSYDIGSGGSGSGGTVSIQGTSVVFLKNNSSIPPTTSHVLHTAQRVTDNTAFGYTLPGTWTAPVYAYLSHTYVSDLIYDINGGSGTVPAAVTQYKTSTTQVANGLGLTLGEGTFVKWNTNPDGSGTDYLPGDIYTFAANTTLYAIYGAPIAVSGVTLNTHEETIHEGDTFQLTATVLPTNAANPEVTWSSDNEEAAAVDQNGLVTAAGLGEAVITATAGGISNQCHITVITRQYTVTFNTQGGSEVASAVLFENTTVADPGVPTRAGYTFNGWYKEQACVNGWNFETDTVKSNVTIWAEWTKEGSLFSGSGTEANPYRIMSAGDLAQLSTLVNAGNTLYSNKYYIQTQDIDLSGYSNWTPIGTSSAVFLGSYDGNGNSISNLNISTTSTTTVYTGLFGYVVSTVQGSNVILGIVKNLVIESGSINAGSTSYVYAGGVAGYLNTGTIQSCSVKDVSITVTSGTNIYAGGIAGKVKGISGYSTAGVVKICGFSGSVNVSTGKVGGIAGALTEEARVSKCYNTGSVHAEGSGSVGGIAGEAFTSSSICEYINLCYNTGNVSTKDSNGMCAGIVATGYRVQVSTCFNAGRVYEENNGTKHATIAGIIGYAGDYSIISSCYNIGVLKGQYIYGIAGAFEITCTTLDNYYADTCLKGIGESTDYTCRKTLEEMKHKETYSGCGFPPWSIVEGQRYPVLQEVPFEYVTSISVPGILEIPVGESETLIPIITPAGSSNKNVTWTSSTPSIATVNEDGLVTMLTDGTAEITVTTVDGGFSDICQVTSNISVTDVSLNKTSLTLDLNANEMLTATVQPANAANPELTWSSTDETVALVDQTGKVTAVGIGDAIITVTTQDGGYTDICSVTVSPKRVTSLTISGDAETILVGEELTLRAVVLPEDATYPEVSWVSSDNDVATVDPTGKVIGSSVGVVTITATADGKSDTFEVTVNKVAVTGVNFSNAAVTMINGNSITLAVTVRPENATYPAVTWESSKPSVATVDRNGKVTAVGVGSAIITATVDEVSDTCEVIVEPATYTIIAAPNNVSYGTVSGGGTYTDGAVVTLIATPGAGYRFVRWKNGTMQLSTIASLSVMMNTNWNITAEFAVIGVPTLTAASSGYNSTKLTWTAVTGASGYEVWRSSTANGTYNKLGTTSSTSYNNTALTFNTPYYYKVNAYCTASTATTYGSRSAYAVATPVPAAPTASASVTSYNSIKVSWSAVPGASGYELRRATTQNGTYSSVKSTSSLSYTNTSLGTGTTYYFKVRAYRMVGKSKVYGTDSAIVSAKPMLTVVTGVSASAYNPTSVKISWGSVSGKSGYEVWRSTSPTGGFVRIKSTSSTSYKDTFCTPFVMYYYQIRVYRTVSSKPVYSASASATVSARPVLGNVTGVKVAVGSPSSVKLSWSSVSGVSGYEIRRSTAANGTYSAIKTTLSRSYTDSNLTPNTTYYYQVVAYRKAGSGKVYSTPCSPVSAKPVFGSVTNPKAVRSSAGKIKLTWSAVSRRKGYVIYRSTNPDSGFVKIKLTTSTSFTDSGLTAGVTYYYKIQAYLKVGSTDYFSGYSAVVSTMP